MRERPGLKPLDPRSWASARRGTCVGAIVLFVFINLTLLPFLWRHSSLEDSAAAASSLYGSGSRYPGVSVPTVFRVLDPGAAAWQTEPEFTLERWLLLHEHSPPLWNAYAAFGTPLAANMQSQPYSPFAWVRLALPSPRGYDFFIMLRLYVAGLCAFLFLRQFAGVLPALVGGTSYMYAGYFWLFVTMPELSTEVLLPGVLYAFERLLRRPGPATAVVTACFLAAVVFGGMPESAMLLLTLSCIYAIVRIVSDGALRLRLPALGLYGGLATALALGLTALLTLPFFEYVGVSFSLHVGPSGGLQGFVERDPFGSSSLVQYLAPLLDGGPLNSILFPADGPHYSGIRGFFGVGVFFFSLVAVFAQVEDAFRRRIRKAPIFFFAIVALFMLAKRWGWDGANWIGLLPGLRQVNFPKYEENLIAISMAVLAGFGVAALCERRCSKPVVWAATVVPLVILAFASYSDRAVVLALTAGRPFYVDAMRGALVSLALASILATFALRGVSARVVGCTAVAFVALELNAAYIVPLYYVLDPLSNQSSSAQNGAPYVVYLQRHLTDGMRFFADDSVLYPEWGSAFQIPDIRALDALYFDRYLPFVRSFFPPSSTELLGDRFVGSEGVDFTNPLERRLLQLSSVEYVASLHPIAVAREGVGPSRLAYAEPGANLYRFEGSIPRISVCARVVLARDGEAARAALVAPAFDPRREVVVEGDETSLRRLAAAPKTDCRAGKLDVYRSLYVRATVDTAGTALVMLNDTDYPGWGVQVDGKDAKIYASDYLFRGVVVGPGHHILEYRYAPVSYMVGLSISIVSLLLLGALSILALRRSTATAASEACMATANT